MLSAILSNWKYIVIALLLCYCVKVHIDLSDTKDLLIAMNTSYSNEVNEHNLTKTSLEHAKSEVSALTIKLDNMSKQTGSINELLASFIVSEHSSIRIVKSSLCFRVTEIMSTTYM